MNRNIILAITGASGAIYALRLLEVLLAANRNVYLTISEAGRAVIKQELDLDVALEKSRFRLEMLFPADYQGSARQLWHDVFGDSDLQQTRQQSQLLHYFHFQDFMAPIASGSALSGVMVVCPCSGTTLSGIAHASSSNLIQRAAEVQLKERRPLILMPRETPLSTMQLENMARVSAAGGVILPAAPGWYHGAERLRDLVDFVVSRICDQLGVENNMIQRWGE